MKHQAIHPATGDNDTRDQLRHPQSKEAQPVPDEIRSAVWRILWRRYEDRSNFGSKDEVRNLGFELLEEIGQAMNSEGGEGGPGTK